LDFQYPNARLSSGGRALLGLVGRFWDGNEGLYLTFVEQVGRGTLSPGGPWSDSPLWAPEALSVGPASELVDARIGIEHCLGRPERGLG
jgi:hypothetical protein